MNETRQFCTFTVDGLFLGIPVEHVQEVIRCQPVLRVPLAPPEVSGLINLRGQIVTAIDLRIRLGRPQRSADRPPMNVVVRTEEGIVSLLVDEIGDVMELSAGEFEAPPENMQGTSRKLIEGAYKLPGKLLLRLDPHAACEVHIPSVPA